MQTELYRHFDEDGRLLYVGMSVNALRRYTQHKSQSGWGSDVAHMTIERFETREEAAAAERAAIAKEMPPWNGFSRERVCPLPPDNTAPLGDNPVFYFCGTDQFDALCAHGVPRRMIYQKDRFLILWKVLRDGDTLLALEPVPIDMVSVLKGRGVQVFHARLK